MIELYLPASGKRYDIRIPAILRVGDIILLIEKCMAQLEKGYFVIRGDAVLCDRITGLALDVNLTPNELGILNGTKLMLI